MRHVVSFSGGKDSTAMLLKMIEKEMAIDAIVFADTGIEFPEMYKHINQVEKKIGRKIIRLRPKKSFEYYMLEHKKTKGKNKGEKGYSWPDFQNRWCTSALKQQVFSRYLDDSKVIEYHGISYDEIERTYKNDNRKIKYPLVEWKMTGADNLQYCYDRGFNWGGLYSKLDRVSCYLCPLQRIGELRVVYNEYPELWNKMEQLDRQTIKKHGRQFRSDYSIEDLSKRFRYKNMQIKMF